MRSYEPFGVSSTTSSTPLVLAIWIASRRLVNPSAATTSAVVVTVIVSARALAANELRLIAITTPSTTARAIRLTSPAKLDRIGFYRKAHNAGWTRL